MDEVACKYSVRLNRFTHARTNLFLASTTPYSPPVSPSLSFFFLLDPPPTTESELMPPQTLALSSSTGISISLHGRGYNLPKYKGHGHAIRVTHSSSNPLLFEVDGDLSTGAYLRVSHHTDLSLEINHRKNKDGNNLSTWYCNGHREWGCKVRWRGGETAGATERRGAQRIIA